MNSERNISVDVLYSVLNSGRFALPLSHSHALEVIAKAVGANSWNEVAQTPSSATCKRLAVRLRMLIVQRQIQVPIPRETVIALVDAITAEPRKELKPPIKLRHFYIEEDVDRDDPVRGSACDLANECYKISKQVAAGDVPAEVMTFYEEDRRILHDSIAHLRSFALGRGELSDEQLWRLFAEVQAETSELLRVILTVRDYSLITYSSASRDFRLNLRARGLTRDTLTEK